MPKIYLAGVHECYFSDEDADLVGVHKCWMLHKTSGNGRLYAYTFIYGFDQELKRSRRRKLYMHRLIAGNPKGFLIDHADRDGLNNRRWNLRKTTGTFNNANTDLPENLCGYRGVTRTPGGRYRARIAFAGDEFHIGTFAHAREAALAYDARAREMFGAFAWCNFDDAAAATRERDLAWDALLRADVAEMPF